MMVGFRQVGIVAMLAGMAVLGGCEKAGAPQAVPGNDGAAAAPSQGVERDTAPLATEPPIPQMAASSVIQSQPGPDGAQVDLLKVAVTGDILTVTLRCSGPEKINSEIFKIKDISVIDDATSQRIGVLKDNDGEWLASNVVGQGIMTDCTIKPGVLWAKFAAPSADAKTVSINLPQVAPFDGVPVTR